MICILSVIISMWLNQHESKPLNHFKWSSSGQWRRPDSTLTCCSSRQHSEGWWRWPLSKTQLQLQSSPPSFGRYLQCTQNTSTYYWGIKAKRRSQRWQQHSKTPTLCNVTDARVLTIRFESLGLGSLFLAGGVWGGVVVDLWLIWMLPQTDKQSCVPFFKCGFNNSA